jgi:hypothetical protein
MTIRHILIDDSSPLHRELPIYRTGSIGTIRLSDSEYKVYASIEITGHDLAALFHYGVVEACNALPFISESGNGLDSWDEAFLPAGNIPALIRIIETSANRIKPGEPERVLLGWQDDPEKIAYWRQIDPERTIGFLGRLKDFADEAGRQGYDLEFIM